MDNVESVNDAWRRKAVSVCGQMSEQGFWPIIARCEKLSFPMIRESNFPVVFTAANENVS